MAFTQLGQPLSAEQKRTLAAMGTTNPADPKGPFLYSTPIDMPKIGNTDMFFDVRP